MIVDVTVTVWCEAIRPGCTFSARISDGANAQFYSGQGATALEALAWSLHDFVSRALLGHPHVMSLPAGARPGDGLDAARTCSRSRRITPAPIVTGPVELPANTNEAGCFEQQIPTSPAPRFFSLASPIATPSPTTRPRSARGARR